MVNSEQLFRKLWNCKNEREVDKIINSSPELKDLNNWRPLGGHEGNLGVVENQQANAAAALVEKIVNSTDAILMRKCYELGLDPKSSRAPASIDDAVMKFFPEYKNWDLTDARVNQAYDIQVLADRKNGNSRDTSIIVYDAGEGQHPEDFEETFCSLLNRNKDEIKFVQGRFNMGGSGALPFCGRKRYQLIGSKRYDGSGDFGYTLIRKRPRSVKEEQSKKNSWYEYFIQSGSVPSFTISELDLDLHRTKFREGTIIKLYSYNTQGNRQLRRDMGRSLNEFFFAPALPYFVVEREVPSGTSFGLNYLLSRSTHVEERISQKIIDRRIGEIAITVFVFRAKTEGRNAKETRNLIQDEYFKNNMAVLFTLNGQVHAHYTSEFITRTLQFQLLKDHLLIHVDCTKVKAEFRDELFMASRDRLKQSKESQDLRERLGRELKGGRLKTLHKKRKESISIDSSDSEELLKNIAKNLNFDENLSRLFGRALELDTNSPQPRPKPPNPKPEPQEPKFPLKRYPSFFNLITKKGKHDFIEIPLNGSRSIQFESDVMNDYFSRSKTGDLQLGIMTWRANDNKGGDEKGTVNEISDVMSVSIQSPQDGRIKVVLRPTNEVKVGDEVEIKADLLDSSQPEGFFRQIFWVRISDPRRQEPKPKPVNENGRLALPQPILVYQNPIAQERGAISWETLSENGVMMDFGTVMFPVLEEDVLESIYMNMDCKVFLDYRSKYKSVEQIELAKSRFISSVYYHSLFLYTISKQRGYELIVRYGSDRNEEELDMAKYMQDLFANHYAEF